MLITRTKELLGPPPSRAHSVDNSHKTKSSPIHTPYPMVLQIIRADILRVA